MLDALRITPLFFDFFQNSLYMYTNNYIISNREILREELDHQTYVILSDMDRIMEQIKEVGKTQRERLNITEAAETVGKEKSDKVKETDAPVVSNVKE